ncbi:MAG: hydrogenase nickel incorporation protein HypB [Planctomycetes bacterium]|nr:hydrogenase nickel incorporation protein HypB [Planctomycetota bacterium]
MKISLNTKILDKNEQAAKQNREFLAGRKLDCLNLISSPGSGKTTILARTVADLKGKLRIGVIEGDIKTDHDSQRIRAAGAAAIQIETEGACHLSAQQVGWALNQLPTADLDIVFVENVGNLVCPSAFDLGESGRVVVLSIPEGDDKPAKYPGTFAQCDVVLINKIDLLVHLAFNLDRVLTDIHTLNPQAKVLQISAATGQGMQLWYDWLLNRRKKA